MKITCEKCNALYDVDESRIPVDGLTMKCPRCMTSFTVNLPAGAAGLIQLEENWNPDGEISPGKDAMPIPATVQYFVRQPMGKTFGPFQERAIATMLEQGKLKGNEDISCDQSTWQPMGTIPNLSLLIRAQAKPLIPPPPASGSISRDEIDLPAPKGDMQDVVDLPGLPGQKYGPSDGLEVIDLPAPKMPAPSITPPFTPPFTPPKNPPPKNPPPAGKGISLQDFDSSAEENAGEVHLNAPSLGVNVPMPATRGKDIVDLPVAQENATMGQDIVDLPAPKPSVADLPAPKRASPSRRPGLSPEKLFPNEETLDLVELQEPKPSSPTSLESFPEVVDLPMPRQNIVDLPTPKKQAGQPPAPLSPAAQKTPAPLSPAAQKTPAPLSPAAQKTPAPLSPAAQKTPAPQGRLDLPIPKKHGIPSSPIEIDDLDLTPKLDNSRHNYGQVELDDSSSLRELDDLPFGMSSAANAMTGEGLLTPKITPDKPNMNLDGQAPGIEDQIIDVLAPKPEEEPLEEESVFRFEPPPKEYQGIKDHHQPTPTVEDLPKPAPPPKKKASLRSRKKLLISFAAGLGLFILVAGLAVGLLTDYGFFGAALISGAHDKEQKARSQISAGKELLYVDTHKGYTDAVVSFGFAAGILDEDLTPVALQVQALAAILYRFGVNPAAQSQAEQLQGKLAGVEDPSSDILKAQGLMALVTGQKQAAMEKLKAISDGEPGDFLAATYLGWSQLSLEKPQEALSTFSRALAARPGLNAALFGQAQAYAKLKNSVNATKILDQLLAKEQSHPGAYLLKVSLLLEDGELKSTEALLNKVLTLKSVSAPSEISLAQAELGDLARLRGQNNEARKLFQTALQIHPLNAKAHLGMGRLLYASGAYTNALTHLQQARSLDPTNIHAAALAAEAVIALGKPIEARSSLAAIMKFAPDAPEILFIQGRVDEAVKNFKSAENFYAQAIKKDPSYFPPYLHLSRIYLDQKKGDQATKLLEQAAEKIPASPAVRTAQGEVFYATKKLDKALENFEDALRLDPHLNSALFQIANVLADQGKLQEAKTKYLALQLKDQKYPNLSNKLGALNVLLKDYKQAALEYDQALEIESPPDELRLEAARAYLLAGLPDKAIILSNLVLNATPSLTKARALMAEGHLLQGKLDVALSEIKQAIGRESSADYYVLQGKIQQAHEQIPEALASYAAALKIDPNLVDVQMIRGMLLVKSGAVKDGLKELQHVLISRPELPQIYLYMGDAYADLGQEAKALNTYLIAIKKDPTLGPAHFKLAQIYADTQRLAPAQTHMQLAIQHADPGAEWLAEAHYVLGNIALQRKSNNLTISSFRTYLKIAPPNAALRADAIQKLMSLGASSTEKQ